MMIAGRFRVRGRRLVAVAVLSYFGIWSVQSLVHMWVLWQDETKIYRKIEAIRAENRQLQADIEKLRNPAALKGIVTGQVPMPSLPLSGP